MSIDQQIQACENRINELEQLKRSKESAEKVDQRLEETYQKVALLKIRKMMNH